MLKSLVVLYRMDGFLLLDVNNI